MISIDACKMWSRRLHANKRNARKKNLFISENALKEIGWVREEKKKRFYLFSLQYFFFITFGVGKSWVAVAIFQYFLFFFCAFHIHFDSINQKKNLAFAFFLSLSPLYNQDTKLIHHSKCSYGNRITQLSEAI